MPDLDDLDNTLASLDRQEEGWAIFEAEGFIQNEDPYHLQRIDEAGVLSCDRDAWDLVFDRAKSGDPFYKRTIMFLVQHSIGEVVWIERTIPDFRWAAL